MRKRERDREGEGEGGWKREREGRLRGEVEEGGSEGRGKESIKRKR